MQVITLDKKKSPDVADWATDKEPGHRVCMYGTIKSNDVQAVAITVDEVGDVPKEKDAEKKKDDDNDVGNEGSGDVGGEDEAAELDDV